MINLLNNCKQNTTSLSLLVGMTVLYLKLTIFTVFFLASVEASRYTPPPNGLQNPYHGNIIDCREAMLYVSHPVSIFSHFCLRRGILLSYVAQSTHRVGGNQKCQYYRGT